jgi:dGTPase
MNDVRQTTEEIERQTLSPHAALAAESSGRASAEDPDLSRTCFQRDRDRILHSRVFRRLAHKTQVFLRPEGDHYRTRITHTLEVTQVARSISRALRLNEDLTEAIAMGHDLGHTPFGHAGEAVLNRLLPGGFHHVRQSLRVVDLLAKGGRGLNLTNEVRQGIGGHSKGKGSILPGEAASAQLTLEAQVVRLADLVAYVNHDLDDAVRARVLTPDDIPEELLKAVGSTHSQRITRMVDDVVHTTNLDEERVIRLSEQGHKALAALRAFLYEKVYENPKVHAEIEKAERVLEQLWNTFTGERADRFRRRHWPAGVDPDESLERAVADFLAGMSDRYCLRMFEEIYLPRPWAVL